MEEDPGGYLCVGVNRRWLWKLGECSRISLETREYDARLPVGLDSRCYSAANEVFDDQEGHNAGEQQEGTQSSNFWITFAHK